MAERHNDVLVLGGGVVGMACAMHLLRHGVSVRVLEQGRIGSGSSHGNCGTLTPSHAIPLLTPGALRKALAHMNRRDAPLHIRAGLDLGRFLWLARLARQGGAARSARVAAARAQLLKRSIELTRGWVHEQSLDCEYAGRGSLYVHRDPRAFREAAAHGHWLEELGIECQTKSDDDLQAMEPALLPGMAGGYFHPGDAHLRPEAYVSEMARRVRELGGIIEENARIERVHTEGRRIEAVRTHRGVYYGERIVMALGAWSPQFARMLDLHLPMQPGKGYSITWSRPIHVPLRPLMLREDSVCVTGWGSGLRMGGTMEFAGYDTRLNSTRLTAIRRAVPRYLRETEGPRLKEMWWGWRPMSVDQLPIIGEGRRWSNLVFATAHGMLGVSMAAATAEIVASICGAGSHDVEIDAFSPRRFGL